MTQRFPLSLFLILYDGQCLVWCVEYAIGPLLSWSTLASLFPEAYLTHSILSSLYPFNVRLFASFTTFPSLLFYPLTPPVDSSRFLFSLPCCLVLGLYVYLCELIPLAFCYSRPQSTRNSLPANSSETLPEGVLCPTHNDFQDLLPLSFSDIPGTETLGKQSYEAPSEADRSD